MTMTSKHILWTSALLDVCPADARVFICWAGHSLPHAHPTGARAGIVTIPACLFCSQEAKQHAQSSTDRDSWGPQTHSGAPMSQQGDYMLRNSDMSWVTSQWERWPEIRTRRTSILIQYIHIILLVGHFSDACLVTVSHYGSYDIYKYIYILKKIII